MTRSRVFHSILILFALYLVSCSSSALNSQEAAARAAFQEWAKQVVIPYKDDSYKTLTNDGTFATVRVTAKLREAQDQDWIEKFANVECRKIGAQWFAYPTMIRFSPTETGKQQLSIQATARSSTDRATATAAAIAGQATASAAATAAKATTDAVRLKKAEAATRISVDSVAEQTGSVVLTVTNRDTESHSVLIGIQFDPPTILFSGETAVSLNLEAGKTGRGIMTHKMPEPTKAPVFTPTPSPSTPMLSPTPRRPPQWVRWRILKVDGYEISASLSGVLELPTNGIWWP